MSKVETIKSALKFLVQKQTEQGSHGFSDADDNEISWDEVIGWLEQQPCKDAIDRQAVLDTIGNVPDYDDGMVWEALSHAQRDVALLTSVTPQPKSEKGE